MLLKLLAYLTGELRYRHDFVGSSSIVCTIFRAYEHVFGRRAGIKAEGALVNDVYYSYTWEHYLSTIEGLVVSFIKGRLPKFSIVYIPQLQLAGLARGGVSPFRFAIAYDTSSVQTAAAGVSATFSYTVTGSNPLLLAMPAFQQNQSVTAITYNAAPMTDCGDGRKYSGDASPGASQLFYKTAPTTGTNNIAVTADGSVEWNIVAISYSGCGQSSQPDAHNFNNATSDTGSNAVVLTTTGNPDCWAVSFFHQGAGTVAAGTGVTARTSVGTNYVFAGDSNGTITPSSTYSTTWTFTGGSAGSIQFSVAVRTPDTSITTAVISALFSIIAPTITWGSNFSSTVISLNATVLAPTLADSTNGWSNTSKSSVSTMVNLTKN